MARRRPPRRRGWLPAATYAVMLHATLIALLVVGFRVVHRPSEHHAMQATIVRDPASVPEARQEEARKRMPTVYAPVDGVIVGLDRTVWIVLHGTAEGPIALVLNGRGDPINTVVMPKRSYLMQANASNIWMVEESETDLTSIVRYRLSGIRCSAADC